MRYLLDTNYLIWAIVDSKKISKKIKDLISDAEQEIFVSTISFWEVALKSSIGKIEIAGFQPEDILQIWVSLNFHSHPAELAD